LPSVALKNATSDDAYLGRRGAILARRRLLQIRAFVARRRHHRQVRGTAKMHRQGHASHTLIHARTCRANAEDEHCPNAGPSPVSEPGHQAGLGQM